MLLGEWKLEEAMEYKEQKGREEGRKEGREEGKLLEREKMIYALKGVLSSEVIAEKFQLSLEYVLAVLSGASVVSEPEVPYNVKKKE